MFRIERKMTSGVWYEVMLSPFETLDEVHRYLTKYANFYPKEDKIYKIINTISNETA